MKKITIMGIIGFLFLIYGCAHQIKNEPQEIVLKLEPKECSTMQVVPKINKTMSVPNYEGGLSTCSFSLNNKGFIILYGGLTIGDALNIWKDLLIFEHKTSIRNFDIYLFSGGGDLNASLALVNHLKKAQEKGFVFTCHASGRIASAAVPILAICDYRVASKTTMFMVHEGSIFKYAANETLKDIRSQEKMMAIVESYYHDVLAEHTTLSVKEWRELENKITWFDAGQAKEWGLIDTIDE